MFDTRNLLLMLDSLFVEWPELADDDQLKRHVLDNGTDFLPALKVAFEEMYEAELLSDAIKNRMGELSQRKARCDRKSDAMRSLMQKLMEHAREHKVVLTEATLSLAQRPSQIVITDETILPPEFVRTKTEPDKTKIKSALLEGKTVEGACLSNGGISLTVRTK
jgi:hypothetical protein